MWQQLEPAKLRSLLLRIRAIRGSPFQLSGGWFSPEMNADPESLHAFGLESRGALPSTPSKEIQPRQRITQQTVCEADPELFGRRRQGGSHTTERKSRKLPREDVPPRRWFREFMMIQVRQASYLFLDSECQVFHTRRTSGKGSISHAVFHFSSTDGIREPRLQKYLWSFCAR